MSTRILVADDHPLMRQGLRALVESIPGCSVVGVAETGREAILQTIATLPDLLLLDLSLPDIAVSDVIGQIRRKSPLQKIIGLGDSRGDIHASEALRVGCQGYLLKYTSVEEVALAIKTVLLGRRFISHEVTNELVGNLLDAPDPRLGRTAWGRLTSRERSVFTLIAQGRTNRATADYLALSPKTVEKHRANVMRKLELRSAVELALLAVDLGIIDRPDMLAAATAPEPAADGAIPARFAPQTA